MSPGTRFGIALGVAWAVSVAAASGSLAAEKVTLDGAIIVADAGQPSFVQYSVEDLAGYLKELTGREVPVVASPDGKARVLIAIGPEAARRVLGQTLPVGTLGEEGYLLKAVSRDGTDSILAAGATPQGTKAAVGALMKAIRGEGNSAYVRLPLDLAGKPAFAKRGMHFNGWAFNYPYTFRGWREQDWQRYLDILSYQGVNLFYLWPFIEIMPAPLSEEDRAYLDECRRVVEYAQKKHGMEVWIMQDYFDAYLAWDTAHGWHALWGWGGWPLGTFTSDPRFPLVAARLRKALRSSEGVDACFDQVAKALVGKYGETPVKAGCIAPLKIAVLSAALVESLAQKAKAVASVSPDPARYPASAANDGLLSTLYWPGALVKDNTEWLQLTWDSPQTFDKVVVRFLQHPSMTGRTIHLQKETAPGKWEDIATAVAPDDPAAPHAVATFQLPARATLKSLRVVNLLDLFEIEVR